MYCDPVNYCLSTIEAEKRVVRLTSLVEAHLENDVACSDAFRVWMRLACGGLVLERLLGKEREERRLRTVEHAAKLVKHCDRVELHAPRVKH